MRNVWKITKTTTILLVTGPPASGKTTIARQAAKKLHLPLVSKDDYKELLFDTLGISDLQWSQKLGAAAFELLFQSIHRLAQAGITMVVEAPFDPERHREVLGKIKEKHSLKIVEVYCDSERELIYQRFKERSESGKRHSGHQDQLRCEDQKEKILHGNYGPLSIDQRVLQVNTDNTFKADQLLNRLEVLIGTGAGQSIS